MLIILPKKRNEFLVIRILEGDEDEDFESDEVFNSDKFFIASFYFTFH